MIQDYSPHTVLAVSYTAQYKFTAVRYKQYTVHILYEVHIMHHLQTQRTYNIRQIHQTQYNKHNVKLTYTRCSILPCHQSKGRYRTHRTPQMTLWTGRSTRCNARLVTKNMWLDNRLLTQSQCIAQQLIIYQPGYCDEVTSSLLIALMRMALHILGCTTQALHHKWYNQNTTHSHCDHLAQPERALHWPSTAVILFLLSNKGYHAMSNLRKSCKFFF